MSARQTLRAKIRSLSRLLKREPLTQYEIEKAEHLFYIQYLRPGMVALDVGANIGELSLLFSRFVGSSGNVHSFECTPDTYGKLIQSISISNRKNISPNCVCVSDAIGSAELHVYDDTHAAWNTLATRPLENYGINLKPRCTISVPTTTIDAYCAINRIEKIDLLKIDVEGAEYQVLMGARNMMRDRKIQCIVFEFGQTTFDMGNDPGTLARLIDEHGYRLQNLIKGESVFPGGSNVATAQYSLHVCTPRN